MGPSAVAGRMAAWSLVACGGLIVVSATTRPQLEGVDARTSVVVGLLTLVTGLVTRLLPWDRWPARATLTIAVVALAEMIAGYALTGWAEQPAAAYTYGVFYLLLFGWIGLSQPPGTSTWFTPLAAGAFVIPLYQAPDRAQALWALLFIVPTGTLLGELVAWTVGRATSASALDASRATDLEALLSAATELQAEGESDGTSDRVAAVATELLQADGAVVVLQDHDGRAMFDGAHGLDTTSGLVAALDETAVEEVLSTGELVLTDARQRGGSRPVLLFPLVGREGPVGAVVVHGPSRLVDPFTRHLLSLFGAQAGTALERRQVIGELTDQAMRDSLTGVGNRRHASGLLASVQPGDAVVLVDLDHFKRVNDTDGHATGDLVLAQLGLFLRNAVREADAVARYGGEEFLVVLRDLQGSVEAAVQRLVEDWRKSCTKATISGGVAVHVAGTNAVETLNRADEALYHAKRTGRDRACAWRADLAGTTAGTA